MLKILNRKSRFLATTESKSITFQENCTPGHSLHFLCLFSALMSKFYYRLQRSFYRRVSVHRGGCLSGGCLVPGGGLVLGGAWSWGGSGPGGVPGPRGWGLVPGVPGPRGGLLLGGRGGLVSQHALTPPPSGETATAADGTHPTGMYSCSNLNLHNLAVR